MVVPSCRSQERDDGQNSAYRPTVTFDLPWRVAVRRATRVR